MPVSLFLLKASNYVFTAPYSMPVNFIAPYSTTALILDSAFASKPPILFIYSINNL
jgi:hypothetical protein